MFCMTALMKSQIQIFQMSSIYIRVLIQLQNLMLLGYTPCFIISQVISLLKVILFSVTCCTIQFTLNVKKGSVSYEGNCYCTINVLEVVCAFRFLNIFIVSREQNNWKHRLFNITLYNNRWFI